MIGAALLALSSALAWDAHDVGLLVNRAIQDGEPTPREGQLLGQPRALELGPVFCASPPPSDVPPVTLHPDAQPGSMAERVHAAFADAPPLAQRLRVVPLARDGVRVTVTDVLAEDCVTWLPYLSPLDEPTRVRRGRYTVAELVDRVNARWWAKHKGHDASRPPGFMRGGDGFHDVETTVSPRMSLRDALDAVRVNIMDAGGVVSWTWNVKQYPEQGVTIRTLMFHSSRIVPLPPSPEWVFDPEIQMMRPKDEPNWGPRPNEPAAPVGRP